MKQASFRRDIHRWQTAMELRIWHGH